MKRLKESLRWDVWSSATSDLHVNFNLFLVIFPTEQSWTILYVLCSASARLCKPAQSDMLLSFSLFNTWICKVFLRYPAALLAMSSYKGRKTDVRPVSLSLSPSLVLSELQNKSWLSFIAPLSRSALHNRSALGDTPRNRHTRCHHTATHTHTPLPQLLQNQRRRKEGGRIWP